MTYRDDLVLPGYPVLAESRAVVDAGCFLDHVLGHALTVLVFHPFTNHSPVTSHTRHEVCEY